MLSPVQDSGRQSGRHNSTEASDSSSNGDDSSMDTTPSPAGVRLLCKPAALRRGIVHILCSQEMQYPRLALTLLMCMPEAPCSMPQDPIGMLLARPPVLNAMPGAGPAAYAPASTLSFSLRPCLLMWTVQPHQAATTAAREAPAFHCLCPAQQRIPPPPRMPAMLADLPPGLLCGGLQQQQQVPASM